METIVKNILTWKKWLALALTVLLGVLLSACQESSAAAIMALEEEGGEERHLAKKIFGGLVVEVKNDRSAGRVALTLRRVPVGDGGRPLCRKATGGLLVVSRVERLFTAAKGRLRSALVVMGDRSRRALGDLAVGECVTVAPDEDDSGRGSVSSRIRILWSRKAQGIRERINGGIVEIWGRLSPGIPPQTKPLPTSTKSGARLPRRAGDPLGGGVIVGKAEGRVHL